MTPIKNIIAALSIALPLLAFPPIRAAGIPPGYENAQKEFRAAARSLNLQTELPEGQVEARPENRLPEAGGSFDGSFPFRALLWIALAIVAAMAVFGLRDSLWSASRSRRLARKEEKASPTTAERMDKAQVEADDLARQGSFAEAMHVLLLQSLGEMRRLLGISLAASLTSREILHRVSLSASGRDAFSDIIGRVEISYFGAHQPREEEYLACRRSFETLAAALRAGGGA